MKLYNIFKGVMVGVLALSLASCEGFLNRPNEDGYNTGNFYKTDAQCIQGVNYLYNSPWYDFQRGFINVGEVMSGNMYKGDNKYLDFSVNATDTDLMNMSYSLWAVNSHANTVIANIRAAEGPSQVVKNQCIGEALTLKALAYFFMVRSFGEVPIVHDNNELLNSGEYNNLKKVTKANVYEYIIITLEKAMELLPKKTSGWDNRIDYYAAEGLLAKVYLTKAGVSGSLDPADLAKAAEYAKDVIDNSGRTLTPVYSDVFRLAPAVYNQTGEPMISWMWSVGRDPWTQQNTLQSDLAMVGFSDQGDCWGGYTGPSVDLMEAFGVSPVQKPSARTGDRDSRRKATMMMAGDKYDYFWTDKGGFDFLKFLFDGGYGKGGPGELQAPCGANNVKHLYGNDADHVAALGKTPQNMAYELPTHILRLSDVYLVYAEAVYDTDPAAALEYVNKVRARAFGEYYETDGKLTELTREAIWKERRLEFAGEGDYWYDFVRRSYFQMDEVIDELSKQKRNAWWNLNDLYEKYYDGGKYTEANWVVVTESSDSDAVLHIYDEDTVVPPPSAKSFTLPFPQEDVVFNPNLAETVPAEEVNIRETYAYNF